MANLNMVSKVLSLFFVLSLISISFAASVTGPAGASLCQGETVQQKFNVCAQTAGNYTLAVEGTNSNWFSIAPSNLYLTAGQCADVFVFITPSFYANSGEYNFQIKLAGNESAQSAYKLSVSQCHTLDLSVTPSSAQELPCKNAVYTVSMKNTGKFSDEYVLFVDNLPKGWATYPQDKFALNAGASFVAQLNVSSDCTADANTFNFVLRAQNTMTNSSASKALSFTVTPIVPFALAGIFDKPTYKDVSCEEFDKNLLLEIKNTSDRSDELSVGFFDSNKSAIGSDVIQLSKSTFALASMESAKFNMILKKRAVGVLAGTVEVKSKTYGKYYSVPFEVTFENCFDASVQRESHDSKDCLGDRNESFNISNTGTQGIDLNLSFIEDGKEIGSKSLSLPKAGESKVSFTINGLIGKRNYVLKANSAFAQKDLNFDLEFENCFDASLSTSNISICPGEDANIAVEITNKGTKDQSFNLSNDSNWLSLSAPNGIVDSNSTRVFFLKGKATVLSAGTFTVGANSKEQQLSRTFSVNVLGNDVCFAFGVAPSTIKADLNCCDGKLLDFNVTNSGRFSQNFKVDFNAPYWAKITEDNFKLAVGEMKQVFVYLSPQVSVAGDFNMGVVVSNDNNMFQRMNLDVNVTPSKDFVDPAKVMLNPVLLDINSASRLAVLELSIKNDSNSGFSVLDVSLLDFNSKADFNKGNFVAPGSELKVMLAVELDNNYQKKDLNASLLVKTSAGLFTKQGVLNIQNGNPISITGFFMAYSAPMLVVLLLVMLALVLLAIRARIEGTKKKAKNGKFAKK